MRLKILVILSCLISGLFLVNSVAADTCATRPASGNHTISDACSFPNALDGVDAGTDTTNTAVMTIGAAGTLTVGVGTTAVVGSISITSGGSIVMIGGTAPDRGIIQIGTPLYATDADADGYPASITAFYTAAATGRVRRNTLTSMTLDCDDAASAQYQNRTCYYDGDNDGFRTTASATSCVGADCTSSSDAYKRESSATIDCNDAAYSATNTCCTDTWVCDTCYDTCCATCCTEHSNCGGTCGGCASGPFAGCSNYDVWNEAHTCYCSYCQINYSCEPCSDCNPHECNCHWACI